MLIREKDLDNYLMHYDEDYLMHWKYITKEKVNGKWKYKYNTNQDRQKEIMKDEAIAGITDFGSKVDDFLGLEDRKKSNQGERDAANFRLGLNKTIKGIEDTVGPAIASGAQFIQDMIDGIGDLFKRK